ncbi:MAG: hypothetical protein WC749_01965 [Dehalococcoidia bacterium]
MATEIISGFLVLLGAVLALVIYSLCVMASRGDRQLDKLEQALPDHGTCPAAPPAPEGYTWCVACQAMFKGASCPGCSRD